MSLAEHGPRIFRFAGDDRPRRASRSRPAPRGPAPRELAVLEAVAEKFGVAVADLRGDSRLRRITGPRQAAFLLLREDLGLGYAQIGALFGGRAGESVFDGLASIRRRLAIDPDLEADLARIRRRLGPAATETHP